ncbi:MAG TPA: hypothetical protein VI916_11410 [Acidimicrobiia bacterium]|nr:hypothetical protein [Acidimicrobiia bacterium]
MNRGRLVTMALPALLALGGISGIQPSAAAESVNTPNMSHVANLQYPTEVYPLGTPFEYELEFGYEDPTVPPQGGSDLETTTLIADVGNGAESRDFVVSGAYRNGLQLIDVTDPENPVIAQTFGCGMAQGDVQIFSRAGRTYALFGQDDISGHALYTTKCFQDALAIYGIGTPQSPGDVDAIEGYGTLIIDITNPYDSTSANRVRTVGWAREWDGSHNTTIDPTGNYIYNSNQDLIPKTPLGGQAIYRMEVFDIQNLANPIKVAEVPFSMGAGPHDVTFSADGNRAYVAALTHTVVLDTTNKAAPTVIGVIEDPAITIHHQADPIDIDGRRFLVISDELAGVIEGLAACPGGGLHIYDVTGDLEKTPLKVGFFAIPQVAPPLQDHLRCTAHVFRAYPEQGIMTIAWYGAGVRVLDISNLAGVSVGLDPNLTGSLGAGIKELGSFYFPQTETQVGSQTWAAKIHEFEADGSAYIFANDLDRGFDVYHYDAGAPSASDPGTWLAGQDVLHTLGPAAVTTTPALPYCALRTT